MIRRNDFERFLVNNYGCWTELRGGDVYIYRQNGARVEHGTFGGHQHREVTPGMARGVLQDLGFTQAQITAIFAACGI